MLIADAQRELRLAFMGGFVAQLIEGGIWALSAGVSLWAAPLYGMAGVSGLPSPCTKTASGP